MDDLSHVLARLEPRLGAITGEPVPIEGGITNRNYRVRFDQRDCVVRLPGKDTTLLGISREAERIANREGARLGIAPALLGADDDWLATEYVSATPGDPPAVRAALETIGAALRSFHDSGTTLPIRFWVPDLLDSYAEVVRDRGGKLPVQFTGAQDLAGRIGEALPLREPVPCHNDLLPGNVLWVESGRAVLLVDWEYAGMGHRLFDLANLAAGSELDEREELRLLTAYFGERPSTRCRASLRLMRIMSDAREAAWGVMQGVLSELDFDFAAYAAWHFERLASAADDPRLEEWFDAAAA